MDKSTAQRVVTETFKASFDRERFRNFVNELTNGFDEKKKQTMQVPDAFKPHVSSCQRIGTYESVESELADVLIVQLTESYKLDRTRTALRDFVAHKLKRGDGEDNAYKEAALVAFVSPDSKSWRFSFVRMEYETKRDPKTGKIKPEERLTPARRYSYLVGAEEQCHTAQTRFLALLQDTKSSPTLAQIEEAFSVESVTKEFFDQYAALFRDTHAALEAIIAKDKAVKADFQAKNVCTVDFAKKLLGQIVFLYFIQKKGWLGVPKGGNWGDGPKNFMRQLADRSIADGKCLFNDVLEPLFYDTLATDRGHEAWCKPFACRISFLNGGLFEPLSGYDWAQTNLAFSNDLFTNQQPTKEGDTGTGILDVFDRYNFTVNEAEPLEKEVAIDPEMLGKVFENLIEENRRKGLGAYYTPREIVHYMCQESLINYLDTQRSTDIPVCSSITDADPNVCITKTRRNLPHWTKDGAIYWITFRMADSLPQEKLKAWCAERDIWCAHHPEPWGEEDWNEYDERFGERFQTWLDAGHGSCALARPEIRQILEDCLLRFDGKRLSFHAGVIMPNHVHLLLEPLAGNTLSELLKGIKGASARKANQILGSTGTTFWQEESYDHIVRSQRQYEHFVRYIAENPIKGKLTADKFWLYQSGTDIPVCSANESQTGMSVLRRADIETFIREGDQAAHYETARKGGTVSYARKLPKPIETHARTLDDALKSITVCDPAIGSGAFPVGMMTEIVKARSALTPYFNDIAERTPYHFKRHAIQNSIYGVDIDAGAVEIAKLRLWLSLVVDEEDMKQIKPLPNLDYKVVVGNSLMGFPFKSNRIHTIEKLKEQYFDETDHDRKIHLREQIDTEIAAAFANSKKSLGYEVSFDFEICFSEVFRARKGFAVVIANPPYVGQKGNKELFQEIATTPFGSRFHQRRMDLFYYFFHLALNISTDNSQSAFITTNYYVTATYADKLRADLHARASMKKLINFNELRIFESALGQHNMLSLFSKGKQDGAIVETAVTRRTGVASPEILRSVLSGTDGSSNYSAFEESALYVGKEHYMSLIGYETTTGDAKVSALSKISRDAVLLGTLCKVFQGIVTGCDRVSPKHLTAFQVNAEKGEGIFVLTEAEVESLSLSFNELRYIRPWFKNSDVKRFCCSTEEDARLIYRSSKHGDENIPNLKRHLARFKEVLINRNVRAGKVTLAEYDDFVKGRGDIDYVMISSAMRRGDYYCISYARDEELFDGPKIVSPQRSYQNTFAFNDVPWYASADVYYICPIKEDVNLKFLLGVLNSKMMYFWLYWRGKRKGEMLELYQKPLTEIPIKLGSEIEREKTAILVDKVMSAKKISPNTDTSQLEREIDSLVYGIYGLTAAEIQIVEAPVK